MKKFDNIMVDLRKVVVIRVIFGKGVILKMLRVVFKFWVDVVKKGKVKKVFIL